MSPVEESLEEADSGFFSFSLASCQVSMEEVTDRKPCPSPTYCVEPSSSPTLEQVLLLEEDLEEQERWLDVYTQHTESDYDLAELVSSLNMKIGRLDVPPSSPTHPSDIITSSSKLFGPFPPTTLPVDRGCLQSHNGRNKTTLTFPTLWIFSTPRLLLQACLHQLTFPSLRRTR